MSASEPWPVNAARAWCLRTAAHHVEAGLFPHEAWLLVVAGINGPADGLPDDEAGFRAFVARVLAWSPALIDEAVAEVRDGLVEMVAPPQDGDMEDTIAAWSRRAVEKERARCAAILRAEVERLRGLTEGSIRNAALTGAAWIEHLLALVEGGTSAAAKGDDDRETIAVMLDGMRALWLEEEGGDADYLFHASKTDIDAWGGAVAWLRTGSWNAPAPKRDLDAMAGKVAPLVPVGARVAEGLGARLARELVNAFALRMQLDAAEDPAAVAKELVALRVEAPKAYGWTWVGAEQREAIARALVEAWGA